jgi:transcriptional/translational regulatory protein YebC/TACO1
MGRQWLHAKRLVAGLKKGRTTSKLVREISVAAKMGGHELDGNPRLFAAVEKAKKESVTKDAIQRAINKGAGIGGEKLVMDHILYEGRAPHNVPVIVEVYTDNVNRTAPEIRVLFKKGQLATTGANKFLFDHVGLVEAHHPDAAIDREAAAIEAGANEVEAVSPEENDDIPEGTAGAKFICDRTTVAGVSKWLAGHGWTVVTSEIGYEVGEFLHSLDEHDDVHRVWAALK